VVGVGASAGGLEAFRQLLAGLPADSGLGFVFVQHLAPTHASSLAEILSRSTAMPVTEVSGELRVEANHVYVIPPGKTMIIAGRNLKLQPRMTDSQHHPIDLFFQSLADDQGDTAIGIVLSGTGNDGSAGLKEIKAAGGITFAQDDSAQHDGMPHSAIAANCVDFVLSPARIAKEITRLAHHPYFVPLPERPAAAVRESGLDRILSQLHKSTGVNFARYKQNTIQRRITRRMVLGQLETLDDYARLLEEKPGEVETLFEDLLIGVTGFFRNVEMFRTLADEVLPRLLAKRPRNEPLRIWVVGCSTGEEAYSLAMLAVELTEGAPHQVPVHVFATDLNAASVEKARSGVYPKSIAQDVSETRLRRFFSEVDGSYRISKAIRDRCVFARHDVLADPPFSRIDLISCRNLLIYLDAAMQKKILSQLHYALKPDGYLVLGNSETVGAERELFEAQNARNKIYRKVGGPGHLQAGSPGTGFAGRSAAAPRPAEPVPANRADPQKEIDRILLARYAPPGVLVNGALEIVQFRGNTSPYLAPGSGKASLNLLKMTREGLLLPLRAALHKAQKQNAAVREIGLRLKVDGNLRAINLEVIPVRESAVEDGAFLILFEEAGAKNRQAPPAAKVKSRALSSRAAAQESAEHDATRLAQELAATREYLQSVIEQQEVVNEELQSANEEAQSANEELQSINEELETSKEEIQSSNEELATVNDELQNRNQEVGRVNNDLVNLLASIDTAIVMIGRDLRIRRYTPLAEKSFNLIASDIGRPLTDIKFNLALPYLDRLLVEVIDSVTVKEMEVRDARGRWYVLRLRPYKTLDGKIDGAVLVLVDIDNLRRAREFAENIVATVREPLLVLDPDLRVRSASQSFFRTFRLPRQEVEGRLLHEVGAGEWNNPALRKALGDALLAEKDFEDFELEQEFGAAGRLSLLLSGRALTQEAGSAPLLLLGMQNVTDRRKLQDSMQRIEQLAQADRNKNEFLAMLAHELRNPLAPLQNALHVLRSAGADETARERSREMMERQIKVMTRLVDDLVDAARVTRGKIGLLRESVELNALLSRVALSIQPQIGHRSQILDLALLPEPVYVSADATRLEQAFGNLLHNASKFSPVRTKISVTAELAHARGAADRANDVVVRIRDDGAGISAETLPHIFELFMQSDRSLDRSQGGLGIGLTLARKLVELHGGSIEAFSAGLGQGSELVVRLPVLWLEKVEPAPSAAASPDEPATKRNILIVDDNIDAADSLAAILRLAGHQVRTAYEAASALQVAAKMRPDAIVLDIGLPKVNGYDVARRLREQPQFANTVLIALSGYGRDEDRERGREAGFDHHFTKPVDIEKLRRALEASLSRGAA
jgi:two-component system CheB/CheR fusion protein